MKCAIRLFLSTKIPAQRIDGGLSTLSGQSPRDFITFEYVMLDGINDKAQHARELIELVKRRTMQIQSDSVQSFPKFRLRTFYQ